MIRAIAVVLVGTGVWMLVGLWTSNAHFGSALRAAADSAGAGVVILLIAQLFIPILKALAGFGLFARRRWSWPAALAALTLDVVTLGVSIGRLHSYGGAASPIPPEWVLGGSVAHRSSAVPMYAIFLLSLVCIALMSTRSVRGTWSRELEAA